MSWLQLISFNTALVVALASPGPALLAIIHTSLNMGRMNGIRFAFGLAAAASFWCLLAMVGLGAIFALVPWLYVFMKICGALYLIYLAVKIWRAASEPLVSGILPLSSQRPEVSAMLVNLTNPKSALFFASVFLTIFPATTAIHQQGLLLLNVFAAECSFYCLVAILMTTSGVRAQYMRARRWIDRTCSVLLASLGLQMLHSSR